MSEPLFQQLASAGMAIARLIPADAEQQAVVGFLVGVVYSLRRAIDLGFADRTGSLSGAPGLEDEEGLIVPANGESW